MTALDATTLLAAAQAETGLRDYGDDCFPARFTTAVERLQGLGMDDAGQQSAALRNDLLAKDS